MKIALKALEPENVDTLLKWESSRMVWTICETLEPLSKYKLETYIRQTLSFDVFGLRQLRLMIHHVDEHLNSIEMIGSVDLFDFDPIHRHTGIGFMLLKTCQQQQEIGKQVLAQFLPYIFKKLQVRSVYVQLSETNINSIQLFEEYGFRKVGELKEFLYENGKFVSQLLYQFCTAVKL